MVRKLCLLLTITTLAISCNKKQMTETVKEVDSTVQNKVDSTVSKVDSLVDKAHNAINSLDVNGIYKGVISCEDCEGIEQTITLGADDVYAVNNKYLGKGINKTTEVKGKYTWDKDGLRIQLDGDNGWYKVEEGKIVQLDKDGKSLMKGNHILTKQN